MKSFASLFDVDVKSVMGMNRRNIEMVMPKNQRKDFPLANHKLLTKTTLADAGIPVAPTIATFETFYEIGEFDSKIGSRDDFVVKPSRGSGGNGILVISHKQDDFFQTAGGRLLTKDNLVRHIADIIFGVYSFDKADAAIVEPKLQPDSFFASLFPYGLSDVRLVLIDDVLSVCMIRVPTEESEGRANLHQGAIGIAVDNRTGVTYRAWHKRQAITRHPESGMRLLGQTVPNWSAIKETARRTAKALPLKFLGVDMVVDKNMGPLVLEVNARPGIEIQNVTGVSLRERSEMFGDLR